MNGRLTDKAYWEASHGRQRTGGAGAGIRRLLGPRTRALFRSYAGEFPWAVLYPRHLPRQPGLKVVEIGSAPGDHLLRFHREFGYEPHGIDYSAPGVEQNRRLFSAHGQDPGRVLCADFLSSTVQEELQGAFDGVVSRGVLEHFEDAPAVLAAHLRMLKTGGFLVLSIPNLRGVNGWLAGLFNRDSLRLHNRALMSAERFAALFAGCGPLKTLFCGYYGTFDFGLFNAPEGTLRQRALSLAMGVQRLLNAVFRVALGRRGLESRLFSPYLIYIGVKLPPAAAPGISSP